MTLQETLVETRKAIAANEKSISRWVWCRDASAAAETQNAEYGALCREVARLKEHAARLAVLEESREILFRSVLCDTYLRLFLDSLSPFDRRSLLNRLNDIGTPEGHAIPVSDVDDEE